MKEKGLIIATVALFLAIFKAEGLPFLIRYSIQIIMFAICLLYLLVSNARLQKRNIMVCIAIPFCISSMIAYADGFISLGNFVNCFYYMVCLLLACYFFMIWVKRGKYHLLITILHRVVFTYCLLSVLSVAYVGTMNAEVTTYIFGGKFITTYFFVLFLGLSYAQRQDKLLKSKKYLFKFVFDCFLVFAFEKYIHCSTGMIIAIFILLLAFVPQKVRRILTKKTLFVVLIMASGLVPIFIEGILQISLVQYFIVDVLGKSITLTDRLPIYTIYLFPLIKERMMFGHGYASSIMHLKTGVYWNAQNGLLDVMLNYGLFGVVGFLTACYKVSGNKNADTISWPLYTVLFSLILAATIEVSYDIMFFFTLSLLFVSRYSENTTCIKNSRMELGEFEIDE